MTTTVFNFGSINIDHVYRVPHFVQPGETLASESLSTVLGGKGANQSVAIARAGGLVKHIGRVSANDAWAIKLMRDSGVDVDHIDLVDQASGHAIIQVDSNGENAIVLHGGANQSFTLEQLERALSKGARGDYLLLQNECNLLGDAMELGTKLGMNIVLNPAPMSDAIKALPLDKLDTLIVNEIEAQMLSGETKPDNMLGALRNMLPATRVVLTLGKEGAVSVKEAVSQSANAVATDVVDTTGAGDTFVGYLLAAIITGLDELAALKQACNAAAISVGSAGAIPSIPVLSQLNTSN